MRVRETRMSFIDSLLGVKTPGLQSTALTVTRCHPKAGWSIYSGRLCWEGGYSNAI